MKKSVLLFTVLLSQTLWGQIMVSQNNPCNFQNDESELFINRSNPVFSQDFNNISSIPDGWNRWYGLMENVLNGGQLVNGLNGNYWELISPSDNLEIGKGLRTNHLVLGTTGVNAKNWISTPNISISAGCYYLSFDITLNKNGSISLPDLNGTDDKFAIVIRKSNGSWQCLAQWDNQGSIRVLNSIDQFPQTITLPINMEQSGTLCIAFYGESTVSNTENSIHIDNVSLRRSSVNLPPTNIIVSEKTKNSARINWTLPEGITSCRLQYKKIVDFATWTSQDLENISTFQLTSLEPETFYKVRLQSTNGNNESIWSDAIVFRTGLGYNDYSIPFVEVFPSVEMPQFWSTMTDDINYVFSYGGAHPKSDQSSINRWNCYDRFNSFGKYHAKANCGYSNSSWLFTPNIDLTTASHPQNLCLVFDIAKTKESASTPPPAGVPDNDDEFRVLVSTDGGETWTNENSFTWKNNGGDFSFNDIPAGTGTTISVPLGSYSNGSAMIAFYCGSKSGNKCFDIHIDNVFIGEANHIFLTEGSWTNAENWKDNSVPSSMDDCVLLKADATVPANSVAQAGCISMMFGSLTIEDGGQLYHSNEGVQATVKKNIQGYGNSSNTNGWYLLSHPMSDNLQTNSIANLTSGNYDLYSFDINEELEWRNFKLFSNQLTSLNAIEGYLYANSQNQTLSYTGTLNAANAMTIDDLKYNGNARLKGFNLIGNPFACNAIVNKPMYVMNDAHDNIIAVSNYEIAPNEAVFVSVSSNNRTVTIMPAYLNQANVNGDGICIEVRKADNTRGQGVLDRARINFSEQDNLEKYTLNANATKLYIPFEGEDFAVLQAQQEGEMPINFKAENNGNYVLNIYPENSKMGYLHLIDNLTGIDTDLLENPNYTFDAKTTDFASRFKLVYSVNGYEDNLENFAYCSGNTLKINSQGDAMIQVIDILGHVISSETISGSCDKELNLCPGVYVLRMVSNNGVKTQKIVLQ